jgi:hypothetical protein
MGLGSVWLTGMEMKPDVMVTGSADATLGTPIPRMAEATSTNRQRRNFFMAPLEVGDRAGPAQVDLR